MTPEERSAQAMAECRAGPVVDVRPARTIAIFAEAIRVAVAAEREACAQVANNIGDNLSDHPQQSEAREVASRIAKAIRARK